MAEIRKYYEAFRFRVEIAGVTTAHLWNAGPFKITGTPIEVPDPGGAFMHDEPGQFKMDTFQIEGPVNELMGLYNLFKNTIDAATGYGEVIPDVFQDVDFVQLDRDGSDLEIVRVYNCYGGSYELTKLDKKENDKRREILTMHGWYFERLPV